MTYYSTPPRSDELYHYGIKGMRWGVRKYQNPDGSLTPIGKRRYNAYITNEKNIRRMHQEGRKLMKQSKQLRRDFHKYRDVDDEDFFESVAREYGLNTRDYLDSLNRTREYYRANKKDIKKYSRALGFTGKHNYYGGRKEWTGK